MAYFPYLSLRSTHSRNVGKYIDIGRYLWSAETPNLMWQVYRNPRQYWGLNRDRFGQSSVIAPSL